MYQKYDAVFGMYQTISPTMGVFLQAKPERVKEQNNSKHCKR